MRPMRRTADLDKASADARGVAGDIAAAAAAPVDDSAAFGDAAPPLLHAACAAAADLPALWKLKVKTQASQQ